MFQDQFKKTEDEYLRLRGQLDVGRITQMQFEAALKDLMVLDTQGRYWMIGADTGKWYVNDGQSWVEANPVVTGVPPGLEAYAAPHGGARGPNVAMLIVAGAIVAICLLGAIGLLVASSTGDLKLSFGNPATPTSVRLPTLPVAPTVAPIFAPTSVPTLQLLPTAVIPTIAAPSATVTPTFQLLPTVVNPTVAAPSATVTPTLTISATLGQADALVFQSKFAEGNAIYQRILQSDPSNVLATVRWARSLCFQGYLESRGELTLQAVTLAENAAKYAPTHPEVALRLARAYDWNAQYDKALASARIAAQLAPDSAEAQAILSETLGDNNKLAEAETAAQKALQLDPNSAEGHRSLAYVLLYKNQQPLAQIEYEKSAQAEPNLALRHYELGQTYLQAKDYVKATAAFQKALSLYPQATRVLVGLGNVYLAQNQYSLAIESFTQATQQNSQSTAAFYGLGNTYYMSDQCAQAIRPYQITIELNPKANLAMTYLGMCQLKLGNLAAAQQAAKQAAAINPDNAETKSLLAAIAAASATPTRIIPPGLYVTQLRMEPPVPGAGQEVSFYATFLNTASGTQNYRWLVYVYKADNLRNSFGETTNQMTSQPVGSVEQKSLGSWKVGIGTCGSFVARVAWLDEDRKATPFTKPDGQVYELPFSTCP